MADVETTRDISPAYSEIEIDSYEDSEPSEQGDSQSTRSLSASVKTYQQENGRTYHGYRAGMYHFPNDANENDRLDYQYHVLQNALQDTLHFAPLENPKNIIDVGTGTGIWAIHMADAYPNTEIEATDLSPIQPTAVPPNVQFVIDDAEQDDWAIPENHYDLVHTRVLMGCFQDFKKIIQKGFKHTKPGGWMESQDITMLPETDDASMPEDWPFLAWSQSIDGASMEAGRPLCIAKQLKQWYIEAGFVDVQEKVVKLPINTWAKDPELKVLGKWWLENLLVGIQGFSLGLLHRFNGWRKEEIEVFLAPVRKSLRNRKVHAYHKLYTVWGRKPDDITGPGFDATTSSSTGPADVDSPSITTDPRTTRTTVFAA